jgi:hypothetical protein
MQDLFNKNKVHYFNKYIYLQNTNFTYLILYENKIIL